MHNRRLWILFIAFLAGFAALALRLVRLQFYGVDEARARIAQFMHPQSMIETYRGTIYDRFGATIPSPRILARDVPSDELAIDYRAISLDDAWLGKKAIDALRASGEWGRFANRTERNRRLNQVKADLAARVDAIPDLVAAALAPLDGISVKDEKDRIVRRYFEIADRIHAMRQDVWIHKYNRDAAQGPSSDAQADTNDAALDAMYRQIQLKDELSAHTLRANLPQDLANYFKAADVPGLSVRDKAEYNRRDYPFGEATAHLVGTMHSIDAAALNARRFREPNLLVENEVGDLGGYLPGDRIGESGVEQLAEKWLHGMRGERLLDLGASGGASGGATDTAPAPEPGRRVEPVPGGDVILTIDAALQRDIYEALVDSSQSLSARVLKSTKNLLEGDIDGKPDGKIHFAALVILSIDGQLLSVISYPSYDPNTLDMTRLALNKDVYRRPLVSRATSASYPPGSTVKPLLASAALAEHVITPGEEITCTGHYFPSRNDIFRCDSVHGPIALVDALSKSCNVYFYTVGQRLGVERLAQWYGDYGFGRDTGMELPEAKGNIPHAGRTDADEAKLLGIGQGPIDVTPLQMANAYATLLRGGVAIAPRILAATPPRQTQAVRIAAQDLATIRLGMEHCTSTGTAKTYFGNFRLRVAGKTGTAEKERVVFDEEGRPVEDPARPLRQLIERHDDAWFVGYAPADKPQYIVAAVMEWGGHGGRAAAPMVREAFLQLQAHGYLPRTDVP